MSEKDLNTNDELIQRYLDGELEEAEKKQAEALLESSPGLRERLRRYSRLGELIQLACPGQDTDDLAGLRDWEQVSANLPGRSTGGRGKKFASWIGLAAAASLALFFYYPSGSTAGNGVIVESIDCTYESFMLINPPPEGGHTIIWINDRSSTVN